MTHSIRPLTDLDIPFVTQVYNWAIEHTTAHFGTTQTTEHAVQRDWLAGRSRYAWLIAHIHGEAAGFAKMGPFRPREGYDWTAELTVYLLPHAQGRGLGKSLYRRLLEISRAQGFRLVVGGVALPNAASEALHRSVGMTEMARLPASGYKFGQWIDVVFFGIELFTANSAQTPAPVRPVREIDPEYPW